MEATLATAEAPAPAEASTEQTVEATPEVELSFDDMAAKSLADARALLTEEPAEEIADPAEEAEASEEELSEETEEGPEEEAEPAEPQSAQARRRLAKEKRLREDRLSFEAEKSEHAERFEKMEAWESSKAASIEDPIAHLRETGLSDDDLMKAAREIFFTLMPGANEDPASQKEIAELKRDRRLAKLERDQAERKAKAEKPADGQVTPEYVATYKANLQATAEDFSHDEYPSVAAHVAEIEANGGDGIEEVMSGLWAVATQSAALNREQGIRAPDLTPKECMGHVEVWLKAQKDTAESQSERSDKKPNQKESAPIRNKQAALKAPKKQPEPLSPEEEEKERMAKAHAMLL